MELTLVERLNIYHKAPKIKCGIGYIAAPEPTPPKPEVPNPITEGLKQSATAFWNLSQLYKNLGV